jgi:DNA-binding transcriptional ArsR family regulator
VVAADVGSDRVAGLTTHVIRRPWEPTSTDQIVENRDDSLCGATSMQITPLTTGTLQLKPAFLEGSPAHGGPLGLIRSLWRDARFTQPLLMWAWIVETGTEGGVTASTTSSHLARLTDAGLVAKARRGRHRYFQLASPEVDSAIEGLMTISGY